MILSLFSFLAASSSSSSRARTLRVENLESRIALSAAGLVEVGAQPSGALDGKIVYLHGGHGITANNLSTGAWGFQRPNLLGMVEDLGNQDQMTHYAEYLWNAGATIGALRPIGHQPNERVLDNDDVEVTFSGPWSDSSANVYFGDAGDVPYRFASTSATETATATYRPNLPEAGFYPVYSWTRAGTDRAADQLYKVTHAGGTTEVTVNHRRIGNGTVYLGTYYFDAGTEGKVEISNRSSEAGRVVIADMIRFGNGVGDIDRGGGISGRDRTDESGLYWVKWHVDRSQGVATSEYRVSSDDRSASVSFSPRYAEYMNQANDGSLSDRVFVSFHSNAGGGGSRGVLGLYNGAGATPNQFTLAQNLGQEVNDDLVAQNGQFEHNWFNRGNSVTLDRADIDFGEINNSSINNEFDATIVETGFHDNQLDAEMLRDTRVRDALARATYQGLIDYFRVVDGNTTPDIDLPAPVTELRATTGAAGSVTLNWTSPEVNSYAGGTPTGYKVYLSTNGYGFDGGTLVAGGGTTTTTLTGLDTDKPYYIKVVAVNAGGESIFSDVVAAMPSASQDKVLIVNGFERIGRTQNPTQPFPGGGTVERVRPRQSNSFDYAVQVASALDSAGAGARVDTVDNDAIIAGNVNLDDYKAVFWILGEESSADDTLDATEQTKVEQYLNQGGNLFISGSEIGWDLDNLNNGRTFYNNSLRASYLSDDANTYNVAGTAGSIFEGLNFSFDDGDLFYNTEFPDVISPQGGATAALSYTNGAGTAAIQYDAGPYNLVMLAFPFETITDEAIRTSVMENVLELFEVDNGNNTPTVTVTTVLDNDNGPAQYTETGFWINGPGSQPGFEGGTFRFALIGDPAEATWQADLPFAGEAEVFVQYPAAANRASGAVFRYESGDEIRSASVDQTVNGLQWVSIGTIPAQAGTFEVKLDAAASTGAQFSIVAADAVRIVLTGSPQSADYNQDGVVDAGDYTVWRANLGETVPAGTLGDGNQDGTVDEADFRFWRGQYGTVVGAAASSATLEAAGWTTFDATMVQAPVAAANQATPLLSPFQQLASQRQSRSGLIQVGRPLQTTEATQEAWELLMNHAVRKPRTEPVDFAAWADEHRPDQVSPEELSSEDTLGFEPTDFASLNAVFRSLGNS